MVVELYQLILRDVLEVIVFLKNSSRDHVSNLTL